MRFVRNRGQVPDRGVQPIVVVPVDPAGDYPFNVTEVAQKLRPTSVVNKPMVDSHRELSRASPTVPIEPAIPCFEQFPGQSHGRAGRIQRPACLEQREDADLRYPCSPDLWASCHRHVRDSRSWA